MLARSLAIAVVLVLPLAASAQDGWLLVRGNPARTGAAIAGPTPWRDFVAWKRPLFMDKVEGFDERDPDEKAKDLVDKLRKQAEPTLLPARFPLIVNDVCVYSSYRDARSVALRELKIAEGVNAFTTIKPGEISWKSLQHDTALATVLEARKLDKAFATIQEALREEKREHLLWANPMIGSFSSDGKIVYLVKDIVQPVFDGPTASPIFKRLPKPRLAEWKSFVVSNELHAYEAFSGKRMWDTFADNKKSPFHQAFTLGAPLHHDGMIYFLNEKDDQLRLVKIAAFSARLDANGQPPIEKMVTIGKVPAQEQVLVAPLRRTQPLHLAHDAGLLVCPTHAGTLIGVDRVTMEVRWTYRYRDEKKTPPAQPHWQAAGPIVLKDRIVFTAADAPGVHCIGLDGKKKWTALGENDLYLAAVAGDIALVVGKTHCRGLSLADGQEKWTLPTGLPAGVGVLDGTTYYLPLQRDGGAIWRIDMAAGRQTGALKVPQPDALGNLALHRGVLVSQSATHIAAFPVAQH